MKITLIAILIAIGVTGCGSQPKAPSEPAPVDESMSAYDQGHGTRTLFLIQNQQEPTVQDCSDLFDVSVGSKEEFMNGCLTP